MNNSVRSTVSDALSAAIVAQHAQRAVPVRAALWANTRRRPDKNDPQLTGTIEVDTLAMGELLAQAIEAGDPKIVLYFDAWQNVTVNPETGEALSGKNGGELPLISGKARNVRVPKAQQADTGGGTDAEQEAQAATQAVG